MKSVIITLGLLLSATSFADYTCYSKVPASNAVEVNQIEGNEIKTKLGRGFFIKKIKWLHTHVKYTAKRGDQKVVLMVWKHVDQNVPADLAKYINSRSGSYGNEEIHYGWINFKPGAEHKVYCVRN